MTSPIEPSPTATSPTATRRSAYQAALETTLAVFLNEGKSHLRDRRSIVGALLFPMLGPAILVAGVRMGLNSESSRELHVHVFGSEHAPRLIAALEMHRVSVTPQSGGLPEAEQAVRDEGAHVALVIPNNYHARLEEGRLGQLDIVLDSSRPKTLGLVRKLEGALSEVIQTLGALRLMARGVSPSVAHPIQLRSLDIATPEQAAAKLLYVIPMMLVLSAFAGGMNIAIDSTAGERERRSLEPLLLTPASRLAVITGKWLTATVAALTVSAVATMLFVLVPPLLPLEDVGLRVDYSWLSGIWTFLWVAPLAAIAVALEMLVASFARSFKEAQTYLSAFLLLPTLPSLFLIYSPIGSTWWTALVPALAQVTAVLDLVKGERPAPYHLVFMWFSSLVITLVLVISVERLWRRERTIFGR